ncbi:MAG: hypothetical protein WB626_12110, partial [Bacteroidota bacterium]
MRIVLFHFYSQHPTPVYAELADKLRARGHCAIIGMPGPGGELVWREGEKVVGRERGPAYGRVRVPLLGGIWDRAVQLLFVLRIRRSIRRLRPDVVQVNTMRYCALLPPGMPESIRFVYDVRQLGLWGDATLKGRLRNRRTLASHRRRARWFYPVSCFASEQAARRVLGRDWRRRGRLAPVGVDRKFLEAQAPGRGPGREVTFI